MEYKPHIYIHADDYGMNHASNARIRRCWEQGCLNGISIMVNGKQPLDQCGERISSALHLNLVEGRPVMPAECVPLLVDGNGYLRHAFFGLFVMSLSLRRKEFEEQIYREINAQVDAYLRLFPETKSIQIDSHQHTHLIPIVFRTMLRVIREKKLNVEYLRIPAEPITPFLLEPGLYHTYRPVNLLKNVVLNLMWLVDRKAFQKSGMRTALFCGIIFSGKMDEYRLTKVFPHFLRLAKKRKMDLEFLFHPGAIQPGEMFLDLNKAGFCNFYRSEGRQIEAETLCSAAWGRIIKETATETTERN